METLHRRVKKGSGRTGNPDNSAVAMAARSLGISRNMLDRWCPEYREREKDAFLGTGHRTAEVEELRRLREENRRLRQGIS